VNLILFERSELEGPLAPSDPRARHLKEILKIKGNRQFDVGIVDGSRGKARIRDETEDGLILEFQWDAEPVPALHPVTLVVGVPRPVVAQRILRDVTSLGVGKIILCGTERAEQSYLAAGLWRNNAYRRHLIEGAQQAFSTLLPEVRLRSCVEDAVADLPAESSLLALDNYEATAALADWIPEEKEHVLAIGPERGWSPGERVMLRARGFVLMDLGQRVLRTEVACIAGLTLVLRAAALL
jgi:RsmE family RNA methyltransferase